MAATAAAAVASSFSTSMQSLNCIRAKTFPNETMLKLSSTIMPQLACMPHSFGVESSLIMTGGFNKWRAPRIVAAVAQEEATAVVSAAADDEEAVAEEQEVVEEVEEGGEVSGEGEELEGSSVNTKLYFGNLPYHCDSAQLAGIIQEYGSPELIEGSAFLLKISKSSSFTYPVTSQSDLVLHDRETGKSRGFAFVTMSTVEDCNAVIQNLDGSEYGGRILRVNYSDKPRPKGPLYPETEYKLFVGNLAWSVTSDSLIQAFQEYGNVVGARVLYDGETGRSRGYGFVSYETKAEMETALKALNGVELEGRAMRISLAQGKKQ